MTPQAQAELAAIREALQVLAAEHPTSVLMVMLEQLVDVACGTNPALKDFMRLQFYRGVMRRLAPLATSSAALPEPDGRPE